MVSPLILSLKKQPNLYGSKIKILSPAKINLYLNITGKYPKGFHRIESIVERISLFDEISIEVKKSPQIIISSNVKSLETKANLCFKAASLIKKEEKIKEGFSIHLEKKIPMGSGLGGGSSNAASTILAIKHLFKLKLTRPQLYSLGKKLGSDVNFFLSQSQFALLKGRGEEVTELKINRKFSHFIIWPNIHISTKKVYQASRVKLTNFFNNVKILRYALKRNDASLIEKNIFNALEKRAIIVCKDLLKVKSFLGKLDMFSAMTGSGSAFYTFGQLRDKRNIKTSINLHKLVPTRWTVFKAHTF
mgnify:CR=1 FL=1|tara:strand:+ start:678 stop:1589 length:912 start_codon:yes stop_codon:yes gene_type:complete